LLVLLVPSHQLYLILVEVGDVCLASKFL
jgi:hypothetical protein